MKRLFPILITAVIMLFTACGTPITYKPALQDDFPVPVSLSAQTSASAPASGYSALNYDHVKAVWISCIDLAPICKDGAEHFRQEFSRMCENCASLGVNTLFVHVRPFGDAFYDSKLFPATRYFCGKPFDALEIMIEEAHKRKLSFHAWINPLRCETTEALDIMPFDYPVKQWYAAPEKYDEYIMYVEDTKHWWLNPAVPEVRALAAEGAAEIVRNYEIDGIHIDDYFYPTAEAYFDVGIYVEQGIEQPLNEWRLENCNKLVRELYEAVKDANPSVEFGIAPQGNIENNYNCLFADVKKWCSEDGFCDYICPQIYFGYHNQYKPFAPTLDVWKELCAESGRRLLIGIAAYKIGTEDEFINDKGIIARQAELALSETDGAALFSYNSLFGSERGREECEHLTEAFKVCEQRE